MMTAQPIQVLVLFYICLSFSFLFFVVVFLHVVFTM